MNETKKRSQPGAEEENLDVANSVRPVQQSACRRMVDNTCVLGLLVRIVQAWQCAQRHPKDVTCRLPKTPSASRFFHQAMFSVIEQMQVDSE